MIPAGEMVALVGPSGAGKSTLLHLLTRLYDPIRGCIAFDGFNLRYVTQESLRAQIGVVFQESILFNTTIRENIRMGKPGASDAEVEAMAQIAEIHSFIVSLPSGYDTVVGKQGGLLSGGQKQRIAIARALLRDPTLLLLDEATSALDPEVEAALISNLKNVTKGRTILMVTHRLASAMGADRILVLDQGRIVEHGRHSELLARGDRYARLWRKAASRVVGKVA
jgi:ATP-binding cassette subfamily B protein